MIARSNAQILPEQSSVSASHKTASQVEVAVHQFALLTYSQTYDAMKKWVKERSKDAQDQIWLLQHYPVFTQGTSCDLNTKLPTAIEIIKTDRGGQITYHGPGQVILYPMLVLKRYQLSVRDLVHCLEQAVIHLLADFSIVGKRRNKAPGVYVDGEKIAALGLRIHRGISYHGVSLNVNPDLAPFQLIDPCGYQGLVVTRMLDKTIEPLDCNRIQKKLLTHFLALI